MPQLAADSFRVLCAPVKKRNGSSHDQTPKMPYRSRPPRLIRWLCVDAAQYDPVQNAVAAKQYQLIPTDDPGGTSGQALNSGGCLERHQQQAAKHHAQAGQIRVHGINGLRWIQPGLNNLTVKGAESNLTGLQMQQASQTK